MTRREKSREELVITGFQKYRQRKGKLEKALTSEGYNPSRICWDFSLLNSDINLSLVGKYTVIETVLFTVYLLLATTFFLLLFASCYYFLLATTCYFLHATCYLSFAGPYLLVATFDLFFATCYLLLFATCNYFQIATLYLLLLASSCFFFFLLLDTP